MPTIFALQLVLLQAHEPRPGKCNLHGALACLMPDLHSQIRTDLVSKALANSTLTNHTLIS